MNPVSPAIVWVHSAGAKRYANNLVLSIASFQLANPINPRICIVPKGEEEQLRNLLEKFPFIDCEIFPIETPTASPTQRSRWLKVRVLSILRRDCLFVDSDTFLIKTLPFERYTPSTIAAVQNRESLTTGIICTDNHHARNLFHKAGWKWTRECDRNYYNTGVIFYRYCKDSIAFVDKWTHAYTEFSNRSGTHYDQPAFNFIAVETGQLQALPLNWNAPIINLPQAARGALIYHYYSSICSIEDGLTFIADLLREVDAFTLTEAKLISAISGPKPYSRLGARPREYRLAGQYIKWFQSFFYLPPRYLAKRVTRLLGKDK